MGFKDKIPIKEARYKILLNSFNFGLRGADVKNIPGEARLNGYRFTGAAEWILKTLDMLRQLIILR